MEMQAGEASERPEPEEEEEDYYCEEFDAESQYESQFDAESAALTEELSRTLQESVTSDEEVHESVYAENELDEEESKWQAGTEHLEQESRKESSLALSARGRHDAGLHNAYDARLERAAVRIQSAARGRSARNRAKGIAVPKNQVSREVVRRLSDTIPTDVQYVMENRQRASLSQRILEQTELDLAIMDIRENMPYTAKHIAATRTIQNLVRARVARSKNTSRQASRRGSKEIPTSPNLDVKMDTALLHWSYEVYPAKEHAERSAVKIQSLHRGRVTRKKIAKDIMKARAREERRRTGESNKKAGLKEEENAATKIQSIQRGKKVRQEAKKKKEDKVQQGSVAHRSKAKGPADQETAARAIQQATRSRAARKAAETGTTASKSGTQAAQPKAVEEDLLRKRMVIATTSKEASEDKRFAQKEEDQDARYRAQLRSVVLTALRGVYNTAIANANVQLKHEDLEKRDAAVKLQSACRGRLARNKVKRRQEVLRIWEHCHACKNRYLPDANFCRECGVKREHFPPQDKKRISCHSCGNLYNCDSKFCRKCGLKREQFPEEEKENRGKQKALLRGQLSEDAQKAIVKIQSSVRKVWKTKEHQAQKNKLITKTKTKDGWAPEDVREAIERREREREMKQLQEKAALQIQTRVRGNFARSRSQKMKEERDRARLEARRKAEERNNAWEAGYRSSLSHSLSARTSLSQSSKGDDSARKNQKLARKKTKPMENLPEMAEEQTQTKPMENLPEMAEEQTQAILVKCDKGHELARSDCPTAWDCNLCHKHASPLMENRWRCDNCDYDLCEACFTTAKECKPAVSDSADPETTGERDDAIKKIQAAQRRRQAKKESKELQKQKEMEEATLKIQAITRGMNTRRTQTTSALKQQVPAMTDEAPEAAPGRQDQSAEQQAPARQEVAAEAAALAGPDMSFDRPSTRRSFDGQWQEDSSSSSAEAEVAVAADSTAAWLQEAIAASPLGGAAPTADVLEAAALAASAAAVRPVTRRSFEAKGLEEVPDIAAIAMAVAGSPCSRPASRQNGDAECFNFSSDIAAAPIEAVADPAEQAAGEEDPVSTFGRGSPSVCDLAVQCSDPDEKEEVTVWCGSPRARPRRQTCYLVRHAQAQTYAWMPGEMIQDAWADFSFGGNFESNACEEAQQEPVGWTTPPLPAQPSSLPRKCPKSGRRLRRPVPVGAGTLRAGAIYNNPPRSPPVAGELVTVAVQGVAEPRQPSAASAPLSRRGRSIRPCAFKEGVKPRSSAPTASSTASPGLGKVRQPAQVLCAFGRVLSGPTATYSPRDHLKERASSPPTSVSQLRRLCDPLFRTRLRSPGRARTASQPPLESLQEIAMADVVRQREGLGTAPATQSGTKSLEDTFADASRDADRASRMRLSSAPGSSRKPGTPAKPRSAKPSPNRPLWQDAGKDVRPGMEKLPWLPKTFNAATVYDQRFLDWGFANHLARPADARHLEEEIMGW